MDLAIVMPAHNESDGIAEFLAEIRHWLDGAGSAVYFVIDDCSTDRTAEACELAAHELGLNLTVIRNDRNLGHGPTALAAYRAALGASAERIVHVDGDGQFRGTDIRRVVDRLIDADVVHGVRHSRSDAWYRLALTKGLAVAVDIVAGGRIPDANTPLRAYRRRSIEALLRETDSDALVPHVGFSVLERRMGFNVAAVDVTSLPRRGAVSTGTMWGRSRLAAVLPPRRLIVFSARAVGEFLRIALSRTTRAAES